MTKILYKKNLHFVNAFLTLFFGLLLLFFIHRAITFKDLSTFLTSDSPFKAMFVGALSDIWISYLLALLVSAVICAPALFLDSQKVRFIKQIGIAAALLTTAVLLCIHQGYIAFFKFQVQPFHLSYMRDWEFVSSNAASFFSWANGLLLLTLIFYAVGQRFVQIELTRKNEIYVFAFLSVAALVAHNRNIYLRVQWFIPENLQTNMAETLYIRFGQMKDRAPLRDEDFERAYALYGNTPPEGNGFERTIFSGQSEPNLNLHPIGPAIAAEFQTIEAEKKNPMVVIMLLESFRPSETGLYSHANPTLTPTIDDLANHGIWFSHAYSSGSVTRSGQEATLCGNFSGRNNSMMRNFAGANYQCLTDIAPQDDVHRFWYHGGDARFDGQKEFWKNHHVDDFITKENFSNSDPHTDWGVSDKRLFAVAAERIGEQSGHQLSLGMVLSITNHIPWTLPSDFGKKDVWAHPSYATTTYTDEAVATFVESLKKRNAWNRTLLFIVSDHGNKVPPYNDLYEHSEQRSQYLQSHINLIVTGGIAESALAKLNVPTIRFDHFVGQSDIAATIAEVTQINPFRPMGKSLFITNSYYPVFSQTEEGLFIPKLDELVSYNEAGKTLPKDMGRDWIYRFHFKATNRFFRDLATRSR